MIQVMKEFPSVDILGVKVNAISMKQSLQAIEGWINSRQAHYVCLAPAHSIMECYDHPELRTIYNRSGLTTPDGMPIVWLCRWSGHPEVERVYGPDLLKAACKYGDKLGWRHYFYGGTSEVIFKLISRLQENVPGLQVAGTASPPFRNLTEEEDKQVIEGIRTAHPDLVWVGIGSPRQERWMVEHLNRLDVPVLIGVGAAFDFLSGNKPQAPRWVQRSGLEWLFRLISEPRRLWRRYLLNYPRFIALMLRQYVLGLKMPD